MATLTLELVTWADAWTSGAWRHHASYQQERPAPAQTVGYVIKDTDDVLTLVQSVGVAELASDGMTIPKGCIIERESLGTVEWEHWHEFSA